jgi:hypothetical protein
MTLAVPRLPRAPFRILGRLLGLAAVLAPGVSGSSDARSSPATSRALIVVGIPGDALHEARFAEIARRWRAWLIGPLGFDPAEVRLLGVPADPSSQGPATREAVAAAAARLKQSAGPDDRVWVFWLGHANHDGEKMRLHLPGPDLGDDEFAALFHDLACREQVFWMTSAGSGWLVQPLSAAGRIVIAATERDQEFNETEFPRALAAIAAKPLATLDADRDGRVSVLEVYRATVAEVAARFASDQRIPTEHAQIDDNGDGTGTEVLNPSSTDGALASRTYLEDKRFTAENAKNAERRESRDTEETKSGK